MQKDIKKLLIILVILNSILIITVIGFYLNDNIKLHEVSEKKKLVKNLKKEGFYKRHDISNDYYKIIEGEYSSIEKHDDSVRLSYNKINTNDISYEVYINDPNTLLTHYSYSMFDDVTTYFVLDYRNNIRYKVTYHNSSGNYKCFKNDNNVFSSECTFDFDTYIDWARNVKKDFAIELSFYDISFDKLKEQYSSMDASK